jgi:hypothetical protein
MAPDLYQERLNSVERLNLELEGLRSKLDRIVSDARLEQIAAQLERYEKKGDQFQVKNFSQQWMIEAAKKNGVGDALKKTEVELPELTTDLFAQSTQIKEHVLSDFVLKNMEKVIEAKPLDFTIQITLILFSLALIVTFENTEQNITIESIAGLIGGFSVKSIIDNVIAKSHAKRKIAEGYKKLKLKEEGNHLEQIQFDTKYKPDVINNIVEYYNSIGDNEKADYYTKIFQYLIKNKLK